MLLIDFIMSLRIDHFFIAAVVVAAIFGYGRQFLKDWGPFMFLWISYDMMRGIADNLGHINVRPVYEWEFALFAPLFGGEIPPFWAQHHKTEALTWMAGFFYALHMAAPIIVALTLWIRKEDRELFLEMSRAFLMTSYAALITFIIFPVAPPWYVYRGYNENGTPNFSQPQEKVSVRESAAGLLDFDKFANKDFFGSIYETFNANPYAAMPSLHAAYSFFVAYFAIKKHRWKASWVAIYPLGVCCSAVYLNHHYIVDLIVGIMYSMIAIYLSSLWTKHRARETREDDNPVEDPSCLNGRSNTQDDRKKTADANDRDESDGNPSPPTNANDEAIVTPAEPP